MYSIGKILRVYQIFLEDQIMVLTVNGIIKTTRLHS